MGEWVESIGGIMRAGSLTAVGVLLPGLLAWKLAQRRGVPLLPPARIWRSAWNGLDLLAGILVIQAIPALLLLAGLSVWEAPVWAFPLQVLFFLFFQRNLLSRIEGPPSEPLRRVWPARLALAAGAWTLLAPLVLGFNGLIDWTYTQLGGEPEEHPLTQLDISVPRHALLLVLQACVAAPWVEECVMRGLLLPWLLAARTERRRTLSEGPWLTLTAQQRAWVVVGVALWPAWNCPHWEAVIFLGLLALGLAALQRGLIRHRRHWCAVYASAVVFAMFHSAVWPSPLPLFILGLGLGWLAVWTRGFFCPALLHAFFNAVSTLYLLIDGSA
jgi:membrane protease YdiL (CAAX protease family)